MEKGVLSENTIRLNKLCKTLNNSYKNQAMISLSDEHSEIKPTGLAILTSLYINPTCNSISSVADSVDVSKGLISREVERLRKSGYVTVTPKDNDKRIVEIVLNDVAIPIVKQELHTLLTLTKMLTEGITEEELATFMRIGSKIQENIKKQDCKI